MPRRNLRISVVIPTYNERRNLPATIKAIRALRPRALEIIVGEGYSTNGTAEIAKRLADKVVFERVRSIGAGRNAGAFATSKHCEVILFVDADTLPPRAFWRRLHSDFIDKSIVGAGCFVMPRETSALQQWFFFVFNLMIWASCVIGKPCISGNCVAYRKSAFMHARGFDEAMAASEDQDLCLRISRFGRVLFYPRIVAYTSRRRLKRFGLFGLLLDWGATTLRFLAGRRTLHYELVR